MKVITSNRPERLFERLAEDLARPLSSPFRQETVVVPSKAMARWVSHAFAREWGICANMDMPFPASFQRDLLERAKLDGPTPADDAAADAFADVETLTWRVAEVLPALLDEPGFEGAKYYVGADLASDDSGQRLVELASKLAGVMDALMTHRQEWVAEWLGRAQPAGSDASAAGEYGAMFCTLFRACRTEESQVDPGQRLHLYIEALNQGLIPQAHLPERVSVFLASSLPAAQLPLYEALARRIPVHFYLLLASDPQAPPHPLVGSLGCRSLALHAALLALDGAEALHLDAAPPSPGTLGALQKALGQGAAGEPQQPLTPEQALTHVDETLQVHSCHGRGREVEVLRDRLLDLFSKQPTLRAEDVLVLAPDIEPYTSHITTTFGRGEGPGATEVRIPYNIAGRKGRAASAAVNALLALLDVVQGRFTAAEVLSLSQLEPVRRSAGLANVDAATLQSWMAKAGVSWGVDGADRALLDLPDLELNTFRDGLRRLFLGLAMDGRDLRAFEGVRPVDSLEGAEVAALGEFADFCDALIELRQTARQPRDVADWVTWLEGALARLVNGGVSSDERRAVASTLGRWRERALNAGSTTLFPLRALPGVLERLFDASVRSGSALSGGVTFDALGSLSGAPFRVVAMLGLGDDFPRAEQLLGFDPMTLERRPLDPSGRELSRAALLRGILSARDALILIYPGQDVRNNAALPASVILAEVLDTLDDMFPVQGTPKPTTFRKTLVTRHPLHPFDPRYFDGQSGGRLFSYAARYVASAKALGAQSESARFLSTPRPTPELDVVELDQLIQTLKDPTKTFLSQVLELREPSADEALPEREPLDMGDSLARWKTMTDLIAMRLTGVSDDDAYRALTSDGALPHGTPGESIFVESWDTAGDFAEAALRKSGPERLLPEPYEVKVGNVRLRGALKHLGRKVDGTISHGEVSFSSGGGGFELEMWVRHVFSQLARGPSETWVVQRRTVQGQYLPVTSTFPPLDSAELVMGNLLRVYELSQRAPLPLFLGPSQTLAAMLAKSDRSPKANADQALASALHKAGEAFRLPGGYWNAPPPESERWHNTLAWAHQDPFAPGHRAVEDDPDSSADVLARKVFLPLLSSIVPEKT